MKNEMKNEMKIMKTFRIDIHAWQILQETKREIEEERRREGKAGRVTLSDVIRYLKFKKI